MNQHKKPLYDALVDHMNNNPISFHVPGHKNGHVFPLIESPFLHPILQMDATELSGLDDLHSPEGPILEAETLLADLFNVKRSFFLVNGSTAGNLAMIMSACKEDQIVLVQRNCHKSVLNALKLAKVQPVFLEPDFDHKWGIAAGVNVETVIEAIRLYPEAKAVIVTYPNYYGMTYDIKRLIEVVHQHNIPVLVDEAHGPHFIVGNPFPMSAVQLGADIVVQSAHKTLPAMTMGSYLHFNSTIVDVNKVIDYLQIFQSSSPSYPIMASLDVARSYLATYHPKDMEYLLKELHQFKEELAEIPGIQVLEYKDAGDFLKVTIQSRCGLSGFALQKRFEEFGVYTELADLYNVLFILPLLKENQRYPFKNAVTKMKKALEGIMIKEIKVVAPNQNKKISRLTVSFKEMDNLEKMEIPIEIAAGNVAAETVIPYPPGIPLLLKGEEITKEMQENLIRLMEDGASFQGGSSLLKGRLEVFRTV